MTQFPNKKDPFGKISINAIFLLSADLKITRLFILNLICMIARRVGIFLKL